MGKMKAVATAFAAIAMTVCLVGCGGGNAQQEQQAPKEDSPANLEVVNSGFYVGDYGSMFYAAIIENPNMTWAAERIQVTVAARDANGGVLNSSTDNIVLMFPDGDTAIAGLMSVNGEVASIDVTPAVNKSNWSKEEEITQAQYLELFPVTGVNETRGSYGLDTVAGEVTNNTEGTYTLTRVYVIYMAEDGSIIGGDYTYLNSDLQPGMALPFSIQSTNVPDHASIEIFVDPGYPQTD